MEILAPPRKFRLPGARMRDVVGARALSRYATTPVTLGTQQRSCIALARLWRGAGYVLVCRYASSLSADDGAYERNRPKMLEAAAYAV